ncbi:MAG: START-like domain-containing protein [Bacteroidota bacterium]
MERKKFTMERLFRASPTIMYKFLSTPDCLIRWFCDEVDINGKEYSFSWEGEEEIALLIEDSENELLRFEWEDADEGEYLEFKMERSPVTGETILNLTDWADDDEVEDQQKLWDTQLDRLRSATGG